MGMEAMEETEEMVYQDMTEGMVGMEVMEESVEEEGKEEEEVKEELGERMEWMARMEKMDLNCCDFECFLC